MTKTDRKVTVAIVQAEVAPTVDEMLERTADGVRRAREAGAELVVFPETWIPGYPVWLDVCRDAALWDHGPAKTVFARLARDSVEVPGQVFERLCSLARASSVTLVVGISERVGEGPGRGTLYNSVLTIGPDGGLLNHHRKLVPTYTERLVWGPGDADGLRAVDTAAGRVSALVCWEHWMPLARQALHDSGEDLHVALWPTAHEMHQVASRQYAFEGRCYVLVAASLMRASTLPEELDPHPGRVTSADQWVIRGGSAIIGPDGRYVIGPTYDEARLLIAEVDLGRIREESMTLDVTGHYHRPELFQFSVKRGASQRAPGIDENRA